MHSPPLDRTKTLFFLCDVQERFSEHILLAFYWREASICASGNAIHGFDEVVSTANKMLKIAKVRRTQQQWHRC
jgi:hypothetical protein